MKPVWDQTIICAHSHVFILYDITMKPNTCTIVHEGLYMRLIQTIMYTGMYCIKIGNSFSFQIDMAKKISSRNDSCFVNGTYWTLGAKFQMLPKCVQCIPRSVKVTTQRSRTLIHSLLLHMSTSIWRQHRFVKIGKVRVFQCFLGCHAQRWVVNQHFLKQITIYYN